MQKELKIGLAIGAVLLVVLIVYVAVPKGDTAGTGDVAQGTDATSTEAPADGEQSSESPAAPTETAAADPASPQTPDQPATGDEVFAPGNTASATAEDPAPAGTSGGTDWASLLNGASVTTTETPAPSGLPNLRAKTTIGGAATPAPAPEEMPAALEPRSSTAVPVVDTDVDPAGQAGSTAAPAGQSPASAAEQPAAPAGGRTHKVAPGESFSKIAKLIYKDERHYLAIQKANPDIDPAKLRPGQVILLPEIAAEKADAGDIATATVTGNAGGSEAEPKAADSATQYKVKSGDSLYKIAQTVYGSSNMIDDIYELNKAAIGPDSSKLKLGMVLKLPPNPNAQAASR